MVARDTIISDYGVEKIGKNRSPLLPKEKDPSFNLRDRLNDVLISEKYILSGYHTGLAEVIDQELYNAVTRNMSRVVNIQRTMFNGLFELGEYQADTASQSQVTDAYSMFKNYNTQFPYPSNNSGQ